MEAKTYYIIYEKKSRVHMIDLVQQIVQIHSSLGEYTFPESDLFVDLV